MFAHVQGVRVELVVVVFLQILRLDEGNQRLVVGTVVLVGDGSGVVHGGPGLLAKSNKTE